MYAPKVSGSTVTPVTARTAIDATALLTVDVIFKAVAALKAQNAAPIDDAFVAIVHPNVACDLMLSDKWVDVHKYAQPENIYRGEIGKIGGVRFVESTEAKCFGQVGAGSGTSQASVYATLVIGANAYGVTDVEGGGLQHIVKQLGSAGTADPLNQRATTGWKALQTAEILSQPYMIRIEHGCATAPTAPAN
jgi:N4-gp56 family major capsid protein